MDDSVLSYILTAIGIACLIEALPWLIAPRKMVDFFLEIVSSVNPEQLRYWGLFLLLLAVIFIWLGKRIFIN